MAVYFIEGKLGAGKSLVAVARIRDYIAAGRRIATNLDLFMEHLPFSRMSKGTPIRIPDKPRLCDLEAIGYGCDEEDYTGKKFGALVLDELGTWFNSRAWNDKERAPVIDWCLHARKMRWDIYFIVQSIDLLDKQLVAALAEHRVACKRADVLPVPFLGTLCKLLTGYRVRFPQFHLGIVFYGTATGAAIVDRWWYRGKDLYSAYDTGQVFRPGLELLNGEFVDMRAPFSYLSRWHLDGRYPRPAWWQSWLRRVNRATVLVFGALAAPISAVTGRSLATVLIEWGVAERKERERLPLVVREYLEDVRRVPAAQGLPGPGTEGVPDAA